jgi:hypothetical protein
MWEAEVGRSWSEANPRQQWETLSENKTKAKRARGMATMAEHFPNNFKTSLQLGVSGSCLKSGRSQFKVSLGK